MYRVHEWDLKALFNDIPNKVLSNYYHINFINVHILMQFQFFHE